MKSASRLLLTFFLFISLQLSAQTESFIWMLGVWKSEKKDVYESWTPGPNSSFLGKTFRIIDADTLQVDSMRIYRIDQLYYFSWELANGKNGDNTLLIRRFNFDGFFAANSLSGASKKINYQLRKGRMRKSVVDNSGRSGNYTYIKLE